MQQTGSNFGLLQSSRRPRCATVGPGTLVSDGLSMMNVDLSSSSFAVCPRRSARGSFLGNDDPLSAAGAHRDNCLLATKVMVPTSGPVREGVGLLGSPPFEIPRSVQRDAQLRPPPDGRGAARALARKNRVNLVTIALYLLVPLALLLRRDL